MDWILNYRIGDENFFNTNDKKLVNKLIKISEGDINLMEKRNSKISILIGEIPEDPLNYLNPFLDILYGKIKGVLISPISMITYVSEDGALKSKSVSCGTLEIENTLFMINHFEDIINNHHKTKYIYPYTIKIEKNKLIFRYASLEFSELK